MQNEDRNSERFKNQERSFYYDCRMYNSLINEAKEKLARKEELYHWEIDIYEQQLREAEKDKRELLDSWKREHGQYDDRVNEEWEFMKQSRMRAHQENCSECKTTYEAKRDRIKYQIELTYEAEKYENKEQAKYWQWRREQLEDQLEKLELGEEQSLEEEQEMGM